MVRFGTLNPAPRIHNGMAEFVGQTQRYGSYEMTVRPSARGNGIFVAEVIGRGENVLRQRGKLIRMNADGDYFDHKGRPTPQIPTRDTEMIDDAKQAIGIYQDTMAAIALGPQLEQNGAQALFQRLAERGVPMAQLEAALSGQDADAILAALQRLDQPGNP